MVSRSGDFVDGLHAAVSLFTCILRLNRCLLGASETASAILSRLISIDHRDIDSEFLQTLEWLKHGFVLNRCANCMPSRSQVRLRDEIARLLLQSLIVKMTSSDRLMQPQRSVVEQFLRRQRRQNREWVRLPEFRTQFQEMSNDVNN